MVAFVIFWSSTFAILFFVLGIIFKGLASALNALLSSIGGALAIGGSASLVGMAFYLLYGIIDGIIKEGLWSVLGMIVLLVIEIGIIGAIVGGLGALILEIVVPIAVFILSIISAVLEGAAGICESAYEKFLTAITKRLDQC